MGCDLSKVMYPVPSFLEVEELEAIAVGIESQVRKGTLKGILAPPAK